MSVPQTYRVSLSGSNWVVIDPTGAQIYSNTSPSLTIQTAAATALKGQEVLLLGNIPITSMCTLNGNYGPEGLVIRGDGNTKIIAQDGWTPNLWNVQGSYITTRDLAFDVNGKGEGKNTIVQITGDYDTLTYCSFTNSGTVGPDYTVNVYDGDYNTITHNIFRHLTRYAIAISGSDAGIYSKNIYIAYNDIAECPYGIKFRHAKDCIAEYNLIDTSVVTWTGVTLSPTGIVYMHGDGPTINCISRFNTIKNTGSKTINSRGILVENDVLTTAYSGAVIIQGNIITDQTLGIHTAWKGVTITDNKVSGGYYGIYLNGTGNYCTVTNNYIWDTTVPLTNNGTGNVTSPNFYSAPPTLTYSSQPVSVPATINGQTISSGWLVTYPPGATVTIKVPTTA